MVPLKVSTELHGILPLTAAAKKSSQELLAVYTAREKDKRALEKARNELESYIVNTRSKLGDDEITGVRTISSLLCWPFASGQHQTALLASMRQTLAMRSSLR